MIVNDRADIALNFPGAGFHTGLRGFPLSMARRLLGNNRLLGYSAHSREEAQDALAAGATYVTLGPVFPSISKPDYSPQGFPWFEDALEALPAQQVLALGGVTLETVERLGRTQVGGAFVMGALMQAPDPSQTAQTLVGGWSG